MRLPLKLNGVLSSALSDFNGLQSRRHDAEVSSLCLRLPRQRRRGSAQIAVDDAQDQSGAACRSIFLNDFEQGENGPDLFRHACLLGREGLVSKHRDSRYRGGRFDRWIKVKNRSHPAFSRVMDAF